jgi:hypothetical protein
MQVKINLATLIVFASLKNFNKIALNLRFLFNDGKMSSCFYFIINVIPKNNNCANTDNMGKLFVTLFAFPACLRQSGRATAPKQGYCS